MASMTTHVSALKLIACPRNSPVSKSSQKIPQGCGLSKSLPRKQTYTFCETVKAQVGNSRSRVSCVAGDVSADGTNYLIAGAIAIALVGSAFPLFFSRKDTCPECDGAGFIRATGKALNANAARKDSEQIVCPRCSGLGKLGQTDK